MIENVTLSNAIAILPGPRTSFLDHLIPLCHQYEIDHHILDHIPEDFQVMVKLHPFTYRLSHEKVASLKQKYQENEQICIVDEIPIIYLGDYSSVAYDFLSLNRPLYTIGGREYSWAIAVKDPRELFRLLEKKDLSSKAREEAYHYTFGRV